MPCYSRIVGTKLTDRNRIIEAMEELKFIVTVGGDFIYGTSPTRQTMYFRRAGLAYSYEGSDTSLKQVSRKYAEIGVKQYARQRGFNIIDNDGVNMTIVNRRG